MFLNMFTTNSGEAFELLDKLAPAVVGVFLLYLPALALAVYSIRRTETLTPLFKKECSCWLCSWSVVEYLFTHLLTENILIRQGSTTFTPSTRSTMPDSPWTVGKQQRTIHAHRENSTTGPHRPRDTELPEIYIFVIGETSRAGNWGLYGYERNTTPKLDAMPDVIHFDDVLTQINANS